MMALKCESIFMVLRENLCFFLREAPSGKGRTGYKSPDCIVFKQTGSKGGRKRDSNRRKERFSKYMRCVMLWYHRLCYV